LINLGKSKKRQENPAHFLSHLTEALWHYTKVDPETPDGTVILMTHFISQSAPDVRKKLKRLKNSPQTPRPKFEMWPLRFTTTERNEKNLMKRGGIRPNSRCWHKLYDKGLS
jgi:hypothetical protein